MSRTTIKGTIFKFNLLNIAIILIIVGIAFNGAAHFYIKTETYNQLSRIADRTEKTMLQHIWNLSQREDRDSPDFLRSYNILNRALKEPLSILNAEYALIDVHMNLINHSHEQYPVSEELTNILRNRLQQTNQDSRIQFGFDLTGEPFAAIAMPIIQDDNSNSGWFIIYSSLGKINELTTAINLLLLLILAASAIIAIFISVYTSKKISKPITALGEHIRSIAERNFQAKISLPANNEITELANHINSMADKLDSHDKAQKTFLQNASHELRTPLMSIQSYAEGIKYGVLDNSAEAADIIIDESKRLTRLVEDLLYLSRLDTVEDTYSFAETDLRELLVGCIDRINGIAIKNNLRIECSIVLDNVTLYADEEKLSRAIINILSNCVRYAQSTISLTAEIITDSRIQITIADDGPGFEPKDLSNLFTRFYKGKNGIFGLGLAIAKSIVIKHHGEITAANTNNGASFSILLPGLSFRRE